MRGVFGLVKTACSRVNGKEVFLLINISYLHTHLKMQAKLTGSYNPRKLYTIFNHWNMGKDTRLVYFAGVDF